MVVIRQSVLDAIESFGRDNSHVEVCGVFVGQVRNDVTCAQAVIEGRHATHQAGAVTFTADTWTHIQQTMDEQYPDQKIVGWYHTHPGFGIFLSEMDMFIHEQFFNLPWQIAYVYDPVREERGLFGWDQGAVCQTDYAVEDDTREQRKDMKLQKIEKLRQWQNRLSVLLAVMVAIFVVAVGWLVVWPMVMYDG